MITYVTVIGDGFPPSCAEFEDGILVGYTSGFPLNYWDGYDLRSFIYTKLTDFLAYGAGKGWKMQVFSP